MAADDYAALIAAGCPDCQDRKGGGKNAVIMELAKYMEEHQPTPAEVLKMSDDGTIKKLIAMVTSGQKITHVSEPAATHPTHETSFVAKVGGPTPRVQPQPATANVMKPAPASYAAREATLRESQAVTIPTVG